MHVLFFFFDLHAHRYSLPPQKDKNDTELPAEGGINMTMLYSDVKLAPNTAERDGFKARETLRYAATLHRSGLISVFFFVCVCSTSPINFVRLTACINEALLCACVIVLTLLCVCVCLQLASSGRPSCPASLER